MGVLEDVLIEAGFYDNGEGWMSARVEPPQPSLRFLGSPFAETSEPQD